MKTVRFLVVLVLASVPAYAGHEMATQACQPLEVDGPGLLVVEMPFIFYGSYWDSPGAEVLETVAPGRSASDPCERDRNAASVAGVAFELLPGTPDSTGQTCVGLVGDTLRVRVDVSDVESSWSLGELIPLTLKCGVFNARRRWPRVRHLEYVVVGDPTFAMYSGIYDLGSVEVPRTPYQEFDVLDPPGLR